MLLEGIKKSSDVRKLSEAQLPQLASEIRQALITRLSKTGGHVGPNLGIVEATIALHYVFNLPKDKLVFDVSHQSYAHKMLTGRAEAYLDPAHYDDVSGFSSPKESPEYDMFEIGHTSTSISLACGLVKARNLRGSSERIVALIGDGSLSGGEALEGLDVAAELTGNFIIIVNDNGMSIAENHGGLYRGLKELRATGGQSHNNLFKAMGLDYQFVANGNDLSQLIPALEKAKNTDHPMVLHIVTEKGDGYKPAETDKETWHYHGPFDIETGKSSYGSAAGRSYNSDGIGYLLGRASKDKSVFLLNAATPGVFGLTPDIRAKLGDQYVDVGIAEETAVAMLSGAGRGGAKPVMLVNATFLQRAYDQIAQDWCINGNPGTLCVFNGSIYGMHDITHIGFYDIAMLSNIPGLTYLAPTTTEEYLAMLGYSIDQANKPIAIRVPGKYVSDPTTKPKYDELERFKVVKKGKKVAILAVGTFSGLGEELADKLHTEQGIEVTLIKPFNLTILDTSVLDSLRADHQVVITLEDGVLDGGFGQKVASYYGGSDMKVLNYGLTKKLYDRYSIDEILRDNHLTADQITPEILDQLD